MSDYTPGPWIIQGSRITNTAGEPICDVVHSVPHNGKRFDANRNLLSATPELLDALKEARPYVPAHHGPVITKIENAIDKAEGR